MSIDVALDGPVLVVTLNRPERLNALTGPDYKELAATWERARQDDDIASVVLTGAGDRAFCTGADLKDTIPNPPSLLDLSKSLAEQRVDRNLTLWKPVIAAVNGYCLGGGLTLMLRTDLRIASSTAVFSLPEVKWGIPVNVRPRLLAPFPRAMEWQLLGDQFDAQEALDAGLVNRVVAPEETLSTALAMAHRLAELPPLAVQAAKELALRSRDLGDDEGLRLEESYQRSLAGASAFLG